MKLVLHAQALALVLAIAFAGCAGSAFPYKDASSTHVIATDTPCYATSPAQGAPPDGTLHLGLEVRLLESQGSYSRVQYLDADGKTKEAYVESQALLKLTR